MTIAFVHSRSSEAPIRIPAMGLELPVRLTPAETRGGFSIIETTNAPGKGPPLHRHAEAEIFRVLEGRYLYQLGERRFFAEAGDVISIPGGAAHGFVNVTYAPARQYRLCRKFLLRRRLLYGGPDGPGETEDDDGLQGQPF
jgi:quercetin dioxygenase-like cupin family protein